MKMQMLTPAQKLAGSVFRDRFELNRQYMLSLRNEALLQNHYLEAGLNPRIIEDLEKDQTAMHLGWESPTCQLRGHFLGHWLSAAAKIIAASNDEEMKLKANRIITELKHCQECNGGEWAGSIPEKYLDWIADAKLPKQDIWAPHYTLHKTLMGLYDIYAYTGSEDALDILKSYARWFHRWSGQFTREQMDNILDIETGGMLEVWANLYGVTKSPEHYDLINRYDRPRLFEPLLAGHDPLTNMHANTTIPEAHGAARAYEVTGEDRWRRIVEAYWKCAVTDRGTFCTGSQTCGEIWTPPYEQASRLGERNQEHCVVYNMIRLADYLLRWTGEAQYADYIERNIYNGILAQQHPQTGMISYFLPLNPGARKKWGHPTHHFWCCHGTLVQAHASYTEWNWYMDDDGLVLAQYIPIELDWITQDNVKVHITLSTSSRRGSSNQNDNPAGETRRPAYAWFELGLDCEKPTEFALKFRLPEWLTEPARITVNSIPYPVEHIPGSFAAIRRMWKNETVRFVFPCSLHTFPLPDKPDTVAFMNGPVVLAGLCDEERMLRGNTKKPETILIPDNEREWGTWLSGWKTQGQERGFRFKPLFEIIDEPYTVYFPCKTEN